MAKKISTEAVTNWIVQSIAKIPEPKINDIPSDEVYIKKLIKHSALKSSSVSAVLSIPGGVAGILSVLPDMAAVWRLQSQMVSNIAAAYGKHSQVNSNQMLWCLFRQFGVGVLKEVVVQKGSNYLIRQIGPKVKQQILQTVGQNIVKAQGTKIFSKAIPLVGSVSAGALTYYDTWRVGKNAMEFYSKELIPLPSGKDGN